MIIKPSKDISYKYVLDDKTEFIVKNLGKMLGMLYRSPDGKIEIDYYVKRAHKKEGAYMNTKAEE